MQERSERPGLLYLTSYKDRLLLVENSKNSDLVGRGNVLVNIRNYKDLECVPASTFTHSLVISC